MNSMNTLSAKLPRFKGAILLVEDKDTVRKTTKTVLVKLGFTVFEAADIQQTLSHWQDHKEIIDLLYTDVVLSGGENGLSLAENLLKDKPTLKVIVSSGYPQDSIGIDTKLKNLFQFLPKPCDLDMMITAMSNCFHTASEGKPFAALHSNL